MFVLNWLQPAATTVHFRYWPEGGPKKTSNKREQLPTAVLLRLKLMGHSNATRFQQQVPAVPRTEDGDF